MKKFEFTNETMTTLFGKTLHRIRAIADIVGFAGNVIARAGQLGGWLEKEENLSQDDNAWVYDDARVYDNAYICGNAKVCGKALVCGKARVYGNAYICGNAKIYGKALVCGNAKVASNASVYGNAHVYDNARIYDNVLVYGNAIVAGDTVVAGNARVLADAVVLSSDHYLTVGPIGSRNDTTTFFRNEEGVIKVACGCFIGTVNVFREKVTATHGNSKHAIAYKAAAALAMAQIDTTVMDD